MTPQYDVNQVKQCKNLEKDLYYGKKRLANRRTKNLEQQVTKGYKNLYNKLLISLEQAR